MADILGHLHDAIIHLLRNLIDRQLAQCQRSAVAVFDSQIRSALSRHVYLHKSLTVILLQKR